MKQFQFTCTYCGHVWVDKFWSTPDFDEIKCPICKDMNIKIKKYEKIDYYE